jgi:hypothetical protein
VSFSFLFRVLSRVILLARSKGQKSILLGASAFRPRAIPVPEKTIALIRSLSRKYGENIFNPNSIAARNNPGIFKK